MNNEELWQATLAQIQLSISPANFATWFRQTKVLSLEGGMVVVSVSNSFAKEWLENKYGKTILKILRSLDEKIKDVKYEIGQSELRTTKGGTLSLPEIGQLDLQDFKGKIFSPMSRVSFWRNVFGSIGFKDSAIHYGILFWGQSPQHKPH